MMKRTTGWIFLVAAAAACNGCGTLISEGAGKVRGAKALYMQIRPDAATGPRRLLAGYTRFELGSFADEIGGKVPPMLMPHFRMEFK